MGKLEPQKHGGALYRPDKGETPNPNGQKKGTRHLSSIIRDLMEDDEFQLKLKNGEILEGMPARNIAKVMYSIAISGAKNSVAAADWLAKHGYGTKVVHDFEQGLFTTAKLELNVIQPSKDIKEFEEDDSDQSKATRDTDSGE